MELYEINEKIAKAHELMYVDEDGVLCGQDDMLDELEGLLLSKTDEIESLALWHKNELATEEAIAKEIKSLQDRKKAHKSKAEWIKTYLSNYVEGKLETPKVKVSWRKSTALSYSENFHVEDLPEELQRVKREPNATAIKSRLKSGEKVENVVAVEKQNIQIK
jgi:hypothetical protein